MRRSESPGSLSGALLRIDTTQANRVVEWAMMAVAFSASMNAVRFLGSVTLTDVFLAVGAAGLLYEVAAGRRDRGGSRRRFWTGYALVIVGGILGALFAVRPLAGVPDLLLFGVAAAPVWVMLTWAPDIAMLRRYTWFWVGGAVANGVWGILAVGDAVGRSAGLTTHPNHLAIVCALGAGLALVLALSETGSGKWLAAASVTVLVLAVLRSGSRAGLVALLATAAVVVASTRTSRPALRPRRGFALPVLVFAVVAGSLAATDIINLGRHNAIQRSLGDATSAASDLERQRLVESAVRRIAEHPIVGSGFEGILQTHNIYLALWAAAGLLGVLGFLLLAWATVQAAKSACSADPSRLFAIAYASGYIGYLIAGSAQNFIWDRYLWLHVGVILCLGSHDRG